MFRWIRNYVRVNLDFVIRACYYRFRLGVLGSVFSIWEFFLLFLWVCLFRVCLDFVGSREG